jgi:uncharacterized membrane protein (DUF2068 family)
MRVRLDQLVPGSKEHVARLQALRTVALMELLKGVVVLAAVISLFWVDPNDVAGAFLNYLHISPDRHFAHTLFRLADRLSNVKIWHLMLGASIYSGLRFTEAVGLWRARAWAEWIALISGAIYLPYEISRLAHRITALHLSIFLINLAVVAFMFYLRIYVPHKEATAHNPPSVN